MYSLIYLLTSSTYMVRDRDVNVLIFLDFSFSYDSVHKFCDIQ